ncbi:MAG TPA: oxygenase MpaB family protein [Thermoleophilaceae bacterium]|nr:oxygenase MpaB family protein [Thermoleophilaceae bacterium]
MASILPSPDEYAELAPTPGSPVWRAFNDVRLLNTSGFATLLQVAHPTVGHGVHQYSSFVKDPWGRLLRTLDYVHGTIYGGPELAGEIGARVRNMHKSIKGTKADGSRYSAMEPDAFAWVHATLAHSVFEGYRVFATPMTSHEREAFWREWLGVGRLIGVRERDLPQRASGFKEYFDAVVDEQLQWTPAIPEVLDTLSAAPPPSVPGLRPGVWRLLRRPMAAQLRVATVGLLPERLRRRLELPYSARERRTLAAMAALSRASGPAMRGPLAEFGPNYVRWRHEALDRGDVAATGSAPAAKAAAA